MVLYFSLFLFNANADVNSDDIAQGWNIYHGKGGCGSCHGKAGNGGSGPNLVDSITNKMSREEFIMILEKGVPGTRMKSQKRNSYVMENMDNLYAYLKARADGVLDEGKPE